MSTLTSTLDAKVNTDETTAVTLHPNTLQRVRAIRLGFSLDWWSVIVAVILGGLIWAGVLPAVGW